ncbi:tRNA dimethylallyltransferase [Quillaja saponaria]|uniref:tRNA dimethylallyltransferase n=1 Tax=Quillaja saponaria TaxID=32244 RepID=A0AAD7Q3G2_QUISA|nr:tRNA dimethylallyltransferase [Quillaja saponaria]
MSAISFSRFLNTNGFLSSPTGTLSSSSDFLLSYPLLLPKFHSHLHILSLSPRLSLYPVRSKSSEAEELSAPEDEWLKKLPEKKKPLYSHSLPCIEAWLKNLGFYQSKEDRAVWLVQKSEWHAQLSLDVTDLSIRYLKSGPGSLDKDVERRFSYALSREDIENAVLGGP